MDLDYSQTVDLQNLPGRRVRPVNETALQCYDQLNVITF
jgi:hypothetical protein